MQCMKISLRSLFYYLPPFSFWKEAEVSYECIYIEEILKKTLTSCTSQLNREEHISLQAASWSRVRTPCFGEKLREYIGYICCQNKHFPPADASWWDFTPTHFNRSHIWPAVAGLEWPAGTATSRGNIWAWPESDPCFFLFTSQIQHWHKTKVMVCSIRVPQLWIPSCYLGTLCSPWHGEAGIWTRWVTLKMLV